MSVGADSTIAPIMASALAVTAAAGTAHYAGMTAALAMLVGAALVLAGLMRAGWIADLLSIPVTTGFLAGISVHIIVGQIPDLLGLPATTGDMPKRLMGILRSMPDANPYPAAIGIGVLAVALIADRLNRRIPGAFIGFIASGLAVWEFALQTRGAAVLGALPIERLRLTIEVPSWHEFTQLLPTSLIVALVCMMQTAAVVRSFPNDRKVQENVSRDFSAIGVGSILAALIGAFAVNSSPPRTAIVHEFRRSVPTRRPSCYRPCRCNRSHRRSRVRGTAGGRIERRAGVHRHANFPRFYNAGDLPPGRVRNNTGRGERGTRGVPADTDRCDDEHLTFTCTQHLHHRTSGLRNLIAGSWNNRLVGATGGRGWGNQVRRVGVRSRRTDLLHQRRLCAPQADGQRRRYARAA